MSRNRDPRPQRVIPGHNGRIVALAYLPDGRRIAAGSIVDGTVKIWNLESGKQEGTLMGHKSGIWSLAVTVDGTKIISGDEDGNIKVWDVKSHQVINEWTHPEGYIKIAVSPDDRFVAVGYGGLTIYNMERERGAVSGSIEVGSVLSSLCFSPDGNKLACGTNDDICVYDVKSGVRVLGPLKGHQSWIECLLWSYDGSRLFSGSFDKTIRYWNSDTGEQIGHPWTGHTRGINCLSLCAVGSILASVSWDATIRFWDATSGRPIGQPLEHEDDVDAVCFSPFGKSVASAGSNGKICLRYLG